MMQETISAIALLLLKYTLVSSVTVRLQLIDARNYICNCIFTAEIYACDLCHCEAPVNWCKKLYLQLLFYC